MLETTFDDRLLKLWLEEHVFERGGMDSDIVRWFCLSSLLVIRSTVLLFFFDEFVNEFVVWKFFLLVRCFYHCSILRFLVIHCVGKLVNRGVVREGYLYAFAIKSKDERRLVALIWW